MCSSDLVVGGSPGMTGAVSLTAEAAFRADAGYVAVATPAASLPVIEARLLEAVKAPLERVDELAQRASALAIGPGLGRGGEERALVRRLLSELAAQGVAVLMISSELPEVLGMADRIVVLFEGRVMREFARAEADEDVLMHAATGQLEDAA